LPSTGNGDTALGRTDIKRALADIGATVAARRNAPASLRHRFIVPAMTEPEGYQRRRGLFSDLAAATAFLTRIPMGSAASPQPIGQSAWAFPLVGAGIGGVATAVFWLAQALGCGDWPAALLAVLVGIALTGALHEDGLADAVDGLFGGTDRATRLAIMRDSRLGTYGGLALVLSVALRAAALAHIGQGIFVGLALVAAHAVSRGALPAVMHLLVPARPDGLAASAGRPTRTGALAAAASGVAIALAALGPGFGATAVVAAGAAIATSAALAQHRIGGYTGDVLGALEQIGEIVMLLAATAR
jgi:adenosylcobinamide-GDP ribazoletransferase